MSKRYGAILTLWLAAAPAKMALFEILELPLYLQLRWRSNGRFARVSFASVAKKVQKIGGQERNLVYIPVCADVLNASKEPQVTSGLLQNVVRLIAEPPSEHLSIELKPGINRIGRQQADNDIVLVTPLISRCHAEITVGDQEILLRDLGSANGTFVNDHRVNTCPLKNGDRIRFAEAMILRVSFEKPGLVARPIAPRIATPIAPPRRPAEENLTPLAVPLADVSRLADTAPEGQDEASDQEMSVLQQEREQLTKLYQFSKNCLQVSTLAELDELMLARLKEAVAFETGFLAYRLASGDWKLVLSPVGHAWPPQIVRGVLQIAMASDGPVVIENSAKNPKLGVPDLGSDHRLLLTLRDRNSAIGAVFLVNSQAPFPEATVDYLELFADIAGLGISNAIQVGLR